MSGQNEFLTHESLLLRLALLPAQKRRSFDPRLSPLHPRNLVFEETGICFLLIDRTMSGDLLDIAFAHLLVEDV